MTQNHILSGLGKKDYERVLPFLRTVSLPAGQILHDVGTSMRYGYFVSSGLVSSLTVMSNGDSVEVGIVGREGFTGLPMLLNISTAHSRLIAQVSGTAERIDSASLADLVKLVPAIERKLARFGYLQAVTMAQIVACNRLHDVEERLSRWLLMTQDRIGGDVLALTHEFLSNMLGSRRASVTIAAGILQRAGIVDHSRGKIRVLSREKLEQVSCECYQIISRALKAYLNGDETTRRSAKDRVQPRRTVRNVADRPGSLLPYSDW